MSFSLVQFVLVESLDDYLPAFSTRFAWCGSVAVHFIESQVGELEKVFGYLLSSSMIPE